MKKVTVKDLDKRMDGFEEKLDKVLKRLAPEEQKPAVGKWYKSVGGIIKYFTTETTAYGIDALGNWDEVGSGYDINSDVYKWQPATDKEVEEALIKEAKKRGFKEGVSHKGIDRSEYNRYLTEGYKDSSYCDGEYIFNIYDNGEQVLLSCGNALYGNGKWAEIVEDKLEINGKEVVIEGDRIKIGCFEMDAALFEDFIDELTDAGIDTIHHPELGDIKVSDLKALIK